MILVRHVFQVKFGKMDEVLAKMAEMRAMSESLGLAPARILTDLSGPMFTFVQEVEVESLEAWQQGRQKMFSSPEWQAATATMPDVFESGRVEFYNIHDV